jgi:hypothetical protein
MAMTEQAASPAATRWVRAALEALPGDLATTAARRLRLLRRPAWRGAVRGTQVSDEWGWDRGGPLDRYYIDKFLSDHAEDVTGRVLEVRDRRYTDRLGRDVVSSDVLDIDPDVPGVTVVGDLADGEALPREAYDCFILAQTLQFIYDIDAAVQNSHAMLAPGGVLLVTVPVTSRISMTQGHEIDFWRFTAASCRRLFGDVFGPDNVSVSTCGNLRSTIAFLRGMSWRELPTSALDAVDPMHQLLACVRAVKR